MKKLQKGAYFTDIHFGAKTNSLVHNQDCLDYIDWFCEKVQENNCDYVGFLGDWNENRSALNIHTLNYAYRGAKKINDLGLPVYFIVGNHDLYYRNSREVHSLIHHNEFDNFQIIDKITIVDEIQDKMLFCPYLFPEEYVQLTKYLDIPFWAGHFEFKGFIVTGYNVTMPTGPSADDFKGPNYIISGHFHKRQTQPNSNVVYIGNTFPTNFGDAGDKERGMMIYDHTDDNMWFENWDECPMYIKTRLSDILENQTLRNNTLLPNSRVNCLVDVTIDFDESTALRNQLIKDYSLRELTLEESPDMKSALVETDIEIDWDSEELQTVDELVLLMLDKIKTDHIDNNMLVELYKELKITHD